MQDEVCVVALVRRKRPPTALGPEALVPSEIDGVPVDVLEVGDLRAQVDRKARLRPAPGGVSLGHYQITAGTFGCVVRDQASGARLLLSNNHVLANGNEASPEDPILQPGTADGGREVTKRLKGFTGSSPQAAATRPMVRIASMGRIQRRLSKTIPPQNVGYHCIYVTAAQGGLPQRRWPC